MEDKQAYKEVSEYLKSHPTLKDNLIEALQFNIKGLQADIEGDESFDWTKSPASREVTNEILGGILMDYTLKATNEEIIELDNYIIQELTKGELK